MYITSRTIASLKVGFSCIGAVAMLIAGILINTAVYKGVKEINFVGRDIGILATSGARFLALTWAASVMMILVNIIYLRELVTMENREEGWIPLSFIRDHSS